MKITFQAGPGTNQFHHPRLTRNQHLTQAIGHLHHVERYENNCIEAGHGRPKHRLRPMRGLRTDRSAQVIIAGLAFLQNLRRGHYKLANEAPRQLRVAIAFTELAKAI